MLLWNDNKLDKEIKIKNIYKNISKIIKLSREFRGIVDMIYVMIEQENLDFWWKITTNQFYIIVHNIQSNYHIKIKFYIKLCDMLNYLGLEFNFNRISKSLHNLGQHPSSLLKKHMKA
jgi:hypothetical protein